MYTAPAGTGVLKFRVTVASLPRLPLLRFSESSPEGKVTPCGTAAGGVVLKLALLTCQPLAGCSATVALLPPAAD